MREKERLKNAKPNYYTVFFQLLSNYARMISGKQYISIDDIKKAYFHFSKIVHPDSNKNDPEAMKKFITLKEVYDYALDKIN